MPSSGNYKKKEKQIKICIPLKVVLYILYVYQLINNCKNS